MFVTNITKKVITFYKNNLNQITEPLHLLYNILQKQPKVYCLFSQNI